MRLGRHVYVDSRARSLALYPSTERYSVKVELSGIVQINLLEMYLKIHPTMLSMNTRHIDFEEADGRQFSVQVSPSQYSSLQLVRAIATAMTSEGSQTYRAAVDDSNGLLTIRSNKVWALKGNSGVNAATSMVNYLGYGYNDTGTGLSHTASFPLDVPTTPFVDICIEELPVVATKSVRYRTPNRTLFTGTPETYMCNIVARVPLLTTTESEQERVFFRATELDMINMPCAPSYFDKLTFSFYDQFGVPVSVGEHNLTLLVDAGASIPVAPGLESLGTEGFTQNLRNAFPRKAVNAQTALLLVLCLLTVMQYFHAKH